MGIFRRKPKHLSPKKQAELDNRLINEAQCGDTETMRTLIAAGAHVHSGDDWALRYAAKDGDTATVQMLLTAGADAHAKDDVALRWAAYHGRTEIVNILAKHIFAPDAWRGKRRADIEVEANILYDKIKGENPEPEDLQKAGTLLADCAIDCWHQVRPPPPPGFKISPLPAQPRPV
jgi:hypothetical protein